MQNSINSIINAEFLHEDVQCKKLNGYENVNYKLDLQDETYVLKTYQHSEELEALLGAENRLLKHLQEPPSADFPMPITLQRGTYLQKQASEGNHQMYRILSYLQGQFLGDVSHDELLFSSLGHFLAQLDIKLKSFQDSIYEARTFQWDLQHLPLNDPYIEDIDDPHNRNIVRYFFLQYKQHVQPLRYSLRKQIIHNDANEWNVLTQNGKVSGLIDFGDVCYSYLINELAVALIYACYDKEDPLQWSQYIIQGYHEVLPLEEKELEVLYYLMAARLCISVCNSAHAKTLDPNNTYTSVSEKPAWQMLHKWLSISPIKAENAFRKAAGFAEKKAPELLATIDERNKHISRIYSTSYNEPIHMASAAFQYMYDVDGNTFLDAYNNIPHVGHSHPKVVAAGQQQMAILNTNTRYLYTQLAGYVTDLQKTFPPSLTKVFLVNSGSAASDLAMRLAQMHTGRSSVMVMELGYHGNTQIAIDISDYKFDNPKGTGKKNHILKTEVPDLYKGRYGKETPNAGSRYGKDAVALIENSNMPIGAFIAEPILGCAGQVPLPPGYLQEVYPAIRKQGGVCISDEVQTGFGRLGDYFWGFEAQGVVPDIVILGKPIANGHPMGAVVCTDEVADSFEKGVEFFSSFGGNPVSCTIAKTVLDVIKEEHLQTHAKEVGDYYQKRLRELQVRYPCIGDVRGMGLFIGVEIVKDHSKTPDPALARFVKNQLRDQHILISTDGRYDNILKSKPPLCFNKANVETVVTAIDKLLHTHYMKE